MIQLCTYNRKRVQRILLGFLCGLLAAGGSTSATYAQTSRADSLIALWQAAENAEDQADALHSLVVYYRMRVSDSALYFVEALEKLARDEEASPVVRMDAYEARYMWLASESEFGQASEVAEKGEQVAFNAQEWERWLDFRHNRGLCYFRLDSYEQALQVARRNAFLSDSLDYLNGMGNAYILEANALLYQGHSDDALRIANQAKEIFSEKPASPDDLAVVWKLIGNVYFFQSVYETALEHYLKAANYYEQTGDLLSLASVTVNIGSVHSATGNLEQAESYFLHALDLRSQLNDQLGQALSNLALGNLWLLTEPEKAQLYYERAANIYRSIGDKNGVAMAYNNIANAYYYAGSYGEAMKNYQRAMEIQREIDNQQEVCLLLNNLGYCYFQLNNEKASIEHFEQGEALARQIGNRDYVANSYEGRADAYQHFGKYKEALVFQTKFIAYNDSINKAETAERVAELQTLYETEKKEREIEQLVQQREIDALRMREKDLMLSKERTRLVFLVAFLFLFLLFVYGSYKRLKLRKQRELQQAVIHEQKQGLIAVLQATEGERKRIAKDLHDGVAQTMSGLRLSLEKLWGEITFEQTNQQKRFRQAIDYLDEACDEVRTISHRMMPKALEQSGLIPALEDLLQRTLQHTSFDYEFDFFGLNRNDRFPEPVEVGLYRIVQELINNVMKHSGAKRIHVQLLRNETHLVLLVEDDGKGFDPGASSGGGIGLQNVKSRVASENGELNIEPAPKRGTVVTIRIPIAHDEHTDHFGG